ncbi:hypothetical protein ANO11243_080300 [Dothideomycetidae sp. 11243]|nr:hypothetical protein ANO11243_080300 [fungal sp. No.11243]
MQSPQQRLHVLLAGGGIGGLGPRQGRAEFAPHVGASIGILPNGARILDQLVSLNKILGVVFPVTSVRHCYSDGSLIAPPSDNPLLYASSQAPSPLGRIDKQTALAALYSAIGDKSALLLNRRNSKVNTSDSSVTVTCQDDSVRQGYPSAYRCLYGISSAVPGLPGPGSVVKGYGHHRSSLLTVSEAGRLYWFIMQKLDRVYQNHEVPRYSDKDAQDSVAGMHDWKPSPTTDFAAVFAKVESFALVALEEAQYKKWTFGRIACCGDSIHKVGVSAFFSAGVWIYTWLHHSIIEVFVPQAFPSGVETTIRALRLAFQWEWVFVFGACYAWLVYSYWDLKKAGMFDLYWGALAAMIASFTMSFGPGATFAIFWTCREYCLAYERHKHAVVVNPPAGRGESDVSRRRIAATEEGMPFEARAMTDCGSDALCAPCIVR